MRLGAIEAGGTKFVCGIGTATGEVLERVSFPTTTPELTIEKVLGFFKERAIDALGVGSFGPIDPRPDSPTYGNITSTPKQHWRNYPFLNVLKDHFTVPIGFDTDVNAAALGEMLWGAAKGFDNCLYITVGTGIGAGAVVNSQLIHGLSHPEMGHILIRRHEQDPFIGNCPYHADCLEGLASGPAIEQRWGKEADALSANHFVWELEAYYLAQAVMNFILTLSPEMIVMGGGVMKQQQLFPLIHRQVMDLLNGYVGHAQITAHIENYIVPPKLGDNAGLCGALAIAYQTSGLKT